MAKTKVNASLLKLSIKKQVGELLTPEKYPVRQSAYLYKLATKQDPIVVNKGNK